MKPTHQITFKSHAGEATILGWPYRVCPASGRKCYANECLNNKPCAHSEEIERELLKEIKRMKGIEP